MGLQIPIHQSSGLQIRNSLVQIPRNFKLLTLFNAMLCLFWVVMIVFSIVKTKNRALQFHDLLPAVVFGCFVVVSMDKGEIVWPRWMTVLLIVIGFVLSLVLTALPLVGMYSAEFIPYIDDTFVVANLQAPVEWAGNEWLYGVAYFGMIVFAMVIWKKAQRDGNQNVVFIDPPFYCFFIHGWWFLKIEAIPNGH